MKKVRRGKMEGEGCYSNHKLRAKIRVVELVLLKGLVFFLPQIKVRK